MQNFTPTHKSNMLDLYRYMVTARQIDILEEDFTHRGEAFFHVSGAGHEGSVALAPHLIPEDWLHCHYRDKALMLARGISPEMFFHSLFCKAASHSQGRQMSAHMSDPDLHILSIVGPVGNSALQAAGVATAVKDQPKAPIVLCSLGDGMSQQGEVLEAIAQAVRDNLPVLFLIEDNHYAISTLTQGQTFFSHSGGSPNEFYGIPIIQINGRDVIEAHQTFGKVVVQMRHERHPAIVIFDVDRLANHTNADDQRVYRSQADIKRVCQECDPVSNFRDQLLENGTPEEELTQIETEIRTAMIEAAHRSQRSPEPEPLFTAKKELSDSLYDSSREYGGTSDEPQLTMLEAMHDVLEHRMQQDERVVLFGEDLEDPKGDVFGVTRGLTEKFPGRVINSPLAEATILGVSVGRALAGDRPVAFLQFADFLPLAYNQIFAELGSMYWRSHGDWNAPVIVMISCGAYRPGLGPFHASSLEALAVHTPGIDVFMPRTASDAVGLLNAAFDSERPTLFFYPKSCLNDRNQTTSSDVERQLTPIGKACIVREGVDITLVSWGNPVAMCEEVAITLEQENVSTEVIDLRSLSPWDQDTVLSSAEKTERLVIVHEDNHSCGMGAEVAATIQELSSQHIRMKRVTRPDTYVPCNFGNQLAVLPSFKSILEAAAELLDLDVTWRTFEQSQDAHMTTIDAIGSSPSDESATLIELAVSPGSHVVEGELVATLEADKAAVEVHASVEGEIVEILVKLEETVKVGTPLMTIRTAEPAAFKPITKEQPGIPDFHRKALVKKRPSKTTDAPLWIHHPPHQTVMGIAAISKALGSRVVSNEKIAGNLSSMTAEEIEKLTGIHNRRWLNEDESALTLGIQAAQDVLEHTGVRCEDLDLVLCCSGTPESMTPSMACLLLQALSPETYGKPVQAYDISAACSGYLYALQTTYDFLNSCPHGKVLLVTTETLSRKLDLTDANTAPIFGDAATATLLYGTTHKDAIRAQLYRPVLSSKGDDGQSLRVPVHLQDGYVSMNGRKVFSEAVRAMISMLELACKDAGIHSEDLDLVVPHQANQRIIDAIRKRIKFPTEKVYSNIREIGNTSSSSIPLCLEQVLQEDRSGDWVGLCAFGGGFTFGGTVLKMI
ncbi:transketolase [candidate division KSB3 bacterium]|uniref:3-methyl-2-oxobutanoate dehydrogenase (2-methylpropanoyl-transferring) n=1 Tax=candidate division KSB3 bacterium TaxID=2044937 RepID=A0A2G6KBS7_9BACT|nr:MAG: transketolase [candidate division KSB3 bacterium]